MFKYFLKRLVSAVLVLVGVSFLVFMILQITPGDPAQIMLGPMATPKDITRIRQELGLNQPLYVQYVTWLGRVLTGDFGRSIFLKREVLPELLNRFGATLILGGAAFLISATLGVLLGILSALRPRGWLDRIVRFFALFSLSMPSFWLGLILIIMFSLNFELLPGSGMYSVMGDHDLGDLLRHLILPTVTLAVVPLAIIARTTRSSMLEVMGQEFVTTARSKGLPESRVIAKHALSNIAVGLVTIFGLEIGLLFSGAIYVETVFSWPGVGQLLVNAILQRDFPLVQGGVLLVASIYVMVNLITDMLYAYIDPRIRFS